MKTDKDIAIVANPDFLQKYADQKDSLENKNSLYEGANWHAFHFDPNTINEADLIKTGLPNKVINHIIHYRNKGGKFYKKEDFSKIYDLDLNDFERLAPYLIFDQINKNDKPVHVDVNNADSAHLLIVKGIGPVFAHRILSMRLKLGAFFEKEQLMDIFGLDQEKYDFIESQIYMGKKELQTIDLNKATKEQLQQNPYIRYKLAGILVQYRNTHGPYKNITDLKKIVAIDEKTYHKLQAYLYVKN